MLKFSFKRRPKIHFRPLPLILDVYAGCEIRIWKRFFFCVEQSHLKWTRKACESFSWEVCSWGANPWKTFLTWTFSNVGYCLSSVWKRLIWKAMAVKTSGDSKCNVANSGRSSVIANHLGVLVGQNRCRFLEMTEHN